MQTAVTCTGLVLATKDVPLELLDAALDSCRRLRAIFPDKTFIVSLEPKEAHEYDEACQDRMHT